MAKFTPEQVLKILKRCNVRNADCGDCLLHPNSACLNGGLERTAAGAIEELMREVAELRERLRWIPVGERLPELHEELDEDEDGPYTYGSSDPVEVITEMGDCVIVRCLHDADSGACWVDSDGAEYGVTHWRTISKQEEH